MLVGSDSSNCGKTSLLCKIITKFSSKRNIIAVKISVRNDVSGIMVNEVINEIGSASDSYKMLKAGASRAFYIKTSFNKLKESIVSYLESFEKNELMVIESLSLRKILNPGVFIVLESDNINKKERDDILRKHADITLHIKQIDNFNLNKITVNEKGWNYWH